MLLRNQATHFASKKIDIPWQEKLSGGESAVAVSSAVPVSSISCGSGRRRRRTRRRPVVDVVVLLHQLLDVPHLQVVDLEVTLLLTVLLSIHPVLKHYTLLQFLKNTSKY